MSRIDVGVALGLTEEGSPSRLLVAIRDHLREALVRLPELDPEAEPQIVRGHVSEALQSVGIAMRADPYDRELDQRIPQAAESARSVLAHLQDRRVHGAAVSGVLRPVAQALGLLRDARVPMEPLLELPRTSTPDARALVERPRLLRAARPVLLPKVPLANAPLVPLVTVSMEAPDAPVVRDLSDLEAFVAKARAELEAFERTQGERPPEEPSSEEPVSLEPIAPQVFGHALTREELLSERARQCFVDLAMFGVMRQPDPGDQWEELEPIEHRLLARVDAIVACGPERIDELLALLDGRPVPDPELLWAALFLLGSFAGDDSLQMAIDLARAADLDNPDLWWAVADALRHAPHPGIDAELPKWLDAPSVARRALAVNVLARRQALGSHTAQALADGEPRVLVEAALALERALQPPHPGDLGYLTQHRSPEVACAAVAAGMAHGVGSGVQRAAERARHQDEDWGLPFVAIGEAREHAAALLREVAATRTSLELYEALGWFGDVTFVEFLLGRLRAGDARAVVSLQRLTGATLTDDEPERTYEEGERPFVESPALPEPELELSADPDVWEGWWRAHRDRADPNVRYRFGRRWSPTANLWELAESSSGPAERRLAWLELVGRAGVAGPLFLDAFVSQQRLQVELIRGATPSAIPQDGWQTRWRRG